MPFGWTRSSVARTSVFAPAASKAYGAIAHHQIDARADYFEQVLRFLVMGNVRRGQLYPLCVGAERVMQAQQIALMARKLGWLRCMA